MRSHEFEVPPQSRKSIAHVAKSYREATGYFAVPYFPIVQLIEQVLHSINPDFIFEVQDELQMSGMEGCTRPDGNGIVLREDVYLKAISGDGRARFTAAHEVGHWAFHTNVPLLARSSSEDLLPPFRSSEWQADTFAAELLMPRWLINLDTDDVSVVVNKFGVSKAAATLRLQHIRGGK